jgi:hypothetical protein
MNDLNGSRQKRQVTAPPWKPLTPLTKAVQGPIFDGRDMALAQVGWLDNQGKVIALHDHSPLDTTEATPLYISLGFFKNVNGELRISKVE